MLDFNGGACTQARNPRLKKPGLSRKNQGMWCGGGWDDVLFMLANETT
jgi:hypothetical protein